jgi:uncharacterized protein DUF4193
MKDTVDDIEEPVDDDIVAADDDPEDAEPSEADLAEATVPPEPAAAGAEVESIQDLLVKQEATEEEAEEEEEEVALTLTREERLAEPMEARVVPIQATEFVCQRCFLVKHRSQLADKKKMLCRDCA